MERNFQTIINSPVFIMNIVSKIEKSISRQLSDQEDDLVIASIGKIPNNIYREHTTDELSTIISNTVIDEIQFTHCSVNSVDLHEMMKRNLSKQCIYSEKPDCREKDLSNNVEVNIDTFLGTTDIASLVKKINEPVSSVNTAHFILDTRYRILENDGSTYFKWGNINNLVRAQGTFNSIGNVKDIISIKLFQFRMPYTETADTPYKRISVLIHELSPQAFIAHEERRYHFMCMLDNRTPSPGWIEVDPEYNSDGVFKFNKTVTHLDMITISLGSPLEPVVFDTDRMVGVIKSYGNPTVIEFLNNHNLLNNDIVYMTEYTSTNPSSDAPTLQNLNISRGLKATIVSPTEISVQVDTSLLKFDISGVVSPTVSSQTLVGVGTSFNTELNPGDSIYIADGGDNSLYIVKSVERNDSLTLSTPYTGLPGAGFNVEKNNTVNENIRVYFGSKRIFFTLEATYLS
jgi:hypothetical protein